MALSVVGCWQTGAGGAFEDFLTPPEAAKPIMRWFWMGEDISASGITHDLEAMRAMGVRGANIMFQSWFGQPRGKVRIFSEEWWRLVMFAGKEADRLGLELSFHICPGWSSSGGPSVGPEDAQKVLRFAETKIKGGRRVSVKLPQVEAPFGRRASARYWTPRRGCASRLSERFGRMGRVKSTCSCRLGSRVLLCLDASVHEFLRAHR